MDKNVQILINQLDYAKALTTKAYIDSIMELPEAFKKLNVELHPLVAGIEDIEDRILIDNGLLHIHLANLKHIVTCFQTYSDFPDIEKYCYENVKVFFEIGNKIVTLLEKCNQQVADNIKEQYQILERTLFIN